MVRKTGLEFKKAELKVRNAKLIERIMKLEEKQLKNAVVKNLLYALSRLPSTLLGRKVLTFSVFLAADSKPLVFRWLTKNFSVSQPS